MSVFTLRAKVVLLLVGMLAVSSVLIATVFIRDLRNEGRHQVGPSGRTPWRRSATPCRSRSRSPTA